MTNFKKQLFSVIASGAVLLYAASPVFADTTIQIVGNGVSTDNNANVTTTHNVAVQQSNNATITNNVTANADSGKNTASENTGGDTNIDTGKATTTTNVSNTVNSNMANVDCGCNNGDTSVLIKKNGDSSDNSVTLHQNSEDGTTLVQNNNADVTNNVDAKANTGKNVANENTGGAVSIETGAAKSTVNVDTTANANVANVGSAGGKGGSLSAVIFGNGVSSDNEINLSTSNDVKVWQANNADVTNNVDAKATSGKNNADENTGGDVSIDTGSAWAGATVDNTVNFNAANVGCDCLSDVTAAADNNGDHSDNNISATLGGDTAIYQGGNDNGNNADLTNNVDANGKSGKNNANENTGPAFGVDPVTVETGDSSSATTVSNTGNQNLYGTPFNFPGGDNVNFSFNFAQVLGFFGVQM